MRLFSTAIYVLGAMYISACGGDLPPGPPPSTGLAFNEVVANNEGVYVDEQGELDDWIELVNRGESVIELGDFGIADSAGVILPLPDITLQPGAVTLLWTDDSPEQGASHLPFKISSAGETLSLYDHQQTLVDQVMVPALADNQAFARFPSATGEFSVCRYTTPRKTNGERCQAAAVPGVTDDTEFQSFATSQWPAAVVPAGLALNELALLPANFIEVKNFGTEAVDLTDFSVAIAPLSATSAPPPWAAAIRLRLPDQTLAPGAVARLAITAAEVEALVLQPLNEGVVVLYDNRDQRAVDHIPFMHWPAGAALARTTTAPYALRFCEAPGPDGNGDSDGDGDGNGDCQPLASRPLGDRSRGLYTPADFSTLAGGSGLANVESVKFVIDLQMANAVHYLSSARWPLHYSFVRETIDALPALNRCDPIEEQQFNQGWALFSQQHYYNNQTRRYHLGTLSRHANAGVDAVEFTFGDAIAPEQMRDAFYLSTARTPLAYDWSLRPQDAEQVLRARAIEGQLPIVGPNAPFQNLTLQTLAPGVAYGSLQFIETAELANALLGPRSVVITDDVPNDIGFVGGLITEAFQTPLAHVNILSQGRGTPNLALPNARANPAVAPLIGKLVRFEVSAAGYSLREAELSEAQAHWDSLGQAPELLTPRLDATTAELIELAAADLDWLPTIGAKAAQLAELYQVAASASACGEGGAFAVPEQAFAIPMRHYLRHFAASGAEAYLAGAMAEPLFATDLDYRRLVLSGVQQMLLEYPVDASLLAAVQAQVQQRFGNARVRFRSSSNTEDLSTFNGAGLYDSISAELDDDQRRVDDAIRTVWASLWNLRAFEERSHANVDQSQVAMAVLVHEAFRNERANGVAIARNILNPTRADQYYINAQAGEASVANPAPGVVTEQLVYQWPPRTPRLTYHSRSSLMDATVIDAAEVRALACAMSAIQTHFKPLLDPLAADRWLTMESEFKFLGAERQLLIKQARPYPMGNVDVANDCREF